MQRTCRGKCRRWLERTVAQQRQRRGRHGREHGVTARHRPCRVFLGRVRRRGLTVTRLNHLHVVIGNLRRSRTGMSQERRKQDRECHQGGEEPSHAHLWEICAHVPARSTSSCGDRSVDNVDIPPPFIADQRTWSRSARAQSSAFSAVQPSPQQPVCIRSRSFFAAHLKLDDETVPPRIMLLASAPSWQAQRGNESSASEAHDRRGRR